MTSLLFGMQLYISNYNNSYSYLPHKQEIIVMNLPPGGGGGGVLA